MKDLSKQVAALVAALAREHEQVESLTEQVEIYAGLIRAFGKRLKAPTVLTEQEMAVEGNRLVIVKRVPDGWSVTCTGMVSLAAPGEAVKEAA